MTVLDTPVHVTDAEFEEVVLKAPLPVVVDFWAEWCAPCRLIAPHLERIAREYAGRLIVAKVDTDSHPQWATRLDVMGIPTLIFFYRGQEVDRFVGALPYPWLKERVEAVLAQVESAVMDSAHAA